MVGVREVSGSQPAASAARTQRSRVCSESAGYLHRRLPRRNLTFILSSSVEEVDFVFSCLRGRDTDFVVSISKATKSVVSVSGGPTAKTQPRWWSREQAHECPDHCWRESLWVSRFSMTAGGHCPSPRGYGRDVCGRSDANPSVGSSPTSRPCPDVLFL